MFPEPTVPLAGKESRADIQLPQQCVGAPTLVLPLGLKGNLTGGKEGGASNSQHLDLSRQITFPQVVALSQVVALTSGFAHLQTKSVNGAASPGSPAACTFA